MNKFELERVETNHENAFSCCNYSAQYFERSLHIHPEIEIVYIKSGCGECIVADNNIRFNAGDLFIFGSYLPHHFKSDAESTISSSAYIQFLECILPAAYTSMPGCANIKQIIANSHRGLCWSMGTDSKIATSLIEMQQIRGFSRLCMLYSILDELGATLNQSKLIASASYTLAKNTNDSTYHRIVEYINDHFRERITLDQLAKYAHMNNTAMCRYFKSKAGQSIFSYILDVRIAIAKEELATTDTPITSIAYETGFSNVSHFNTNFKKATHLTPSEYRKQVR